MGSAGRRSGPTVLVEGRSDAAAFAALAPRVGLGPDDAKVVDMGGVSNFRREWTRASAGGTTLGLCDEREAPYLCRVLRDAGLEVPAVADLPAAGCFVCRADLEEELIRALTPERATRLVVAAGDGAALDRFRRMPAATAPRPCETPTGARDTLQRGVSRAPAGVSRATGSAGRRARTAPAWRPASRCRR